MRRTTTRSALWTVAPGLAVASLGLLAGAAPATAHHAFSAEFDANRPLRLEGDGLEDRMDQSALLDPRRRGRRGWSGR